MCYKYIQAHSFPLHSRPCCYCQSCIYHTSNGRSVVRSTSVLGRERKWFQAQNIVTNRPTHPSNIVDPIPSVLGLHERSVIYTGVSPLPRSLDKYSPGYRYFSNSFCSKRSLILPPCDIVGSKTFCALFSRSLIRNRLIVMTIYVGLSMW